MIVKSTALRAIILPTKVGIHPRVLLPGINTIPDEEWLKVRPHLADRIDDTIFEVHGKVTQVAASKQGDKTIPASTRVDSVEPWEIKDLKVAAKLVEETNRVDLLKAWEKNEGRDSIRAALKTRIEYIEKYGTEDQSKK